MAERVMLMVFCYDIVEARVRARVADLLEKHAARVQDSVFEVRLTRVAADRLFVRLTALLDAGDMLRMYAIGAVGLERCQAQGGAPINGDGDYWIV